MIMNPHLKKALQPHQLVKFPWETIKKHRLLTELELNLLRNWNKANVQKLKDVSKLN